MRAYLTQIALFTWPESYTYHWNYFTINRKIITVVVLVVAIVVVVVVVIVVVVVVVETIIIKKVHVYKNFNYL
jgi:hypothetical protein